MTEHIISENIKLYRKRANLTQSELAERLFVTCQTISKWEKGMSLPTIDKLISLSDIFETSIDNLVKTHVQKTNSGYIAIDGGGTKTEFILFKETGEILKRLTLDGTNPNVCGIEKSSSTLKIGIDILIGTQYNINGIFAGIAGCGAKPNCDELCRILRKEYPSYKINISSDIINVIHSVRNVKKCVAAISGTGVATFAYNDGELARIGGWGYLFDYAGSGFDIGRDAIRYALEYETGLRPHSPLYDKIVKKHGKEIDSSVSEIYKNGNDYIASFAPIVFEAAREGDKTAEEIIAKSMTHLSKLITNASKKYSCTNTCIISGGLTKEKDILEKYLKQNIDRNINIIFPKHPQIYGAILKCMSLFGPNKYDEKLFDTNFDTTYQERKN